MKEAIKLSTGNLHPVTDQEEILKNRITELTNEMNQFTYIVSHDLQAPLRTVTGFLDLLDRRYSDKLDDSAKQFISYAVKGAAKMKDLIVELLEYSRLSSVNRELVQVDLTLLMKEVVQSMSERITGSGATITYADLPVITADKKQMIRLFQHLIENAIKFQGTYSPVIHISAAREKQQWIISVKDNGMGIDAAFADKIFIIFRRLQTDELKYPGTGTGLAVCKKIAELHGGSIEVISEPGNGSTFLLTLPE